MSTISAWNYITSNWNCPIWQAIPNDIKRILGLNSKIGMSSGMLVTENGAKGINNFVNQMNRKQKEHKP